MRRDFIGAMSRNSIALVLKTRVGNGMGVQVPLAPPKTRNCKVIWITLLTENQCDA